MAWTIERVVELMAGGTFKSLSPDDDKDFEELEKSFEALKPTSAFKDGMIVMMMLSPHDWSRLDWLDHLELIHSKEHKEKALHLVVKWRQLFDVEFNLISIWLVQAFRKANEYNYEVPTDWVVQLKTAVLRAALNSNIRRFDLDLIQDATLWLEYCDTKRPS